MAVGKSAQAFGNVWTAARAAYLDDIKLELEQRSLIFPDLSADIDLTCTFTSGIADTFGTWAEIADNDDPATTFSSLSESLNGHISALKIRTMSVANTLYVIELGHGPDASHITIFDAHAFGSGSKKIDSDEQVRFRPLEISAGQKVWYRMKTEDTLNATVTVTLRYHYH